MKRIRNICETGSARVLDRLGGVVVEHGDSIDIEDDEFADSLLKQTDVWALDAAAKTGGK